MLSKILLFAALFIFTLRISAQPFQRLPENGGEGYHGATPRSYIIQWDSLPQVMYYEYVITDNSLCFLGCSGDTHMDRVTATFAMEKNLVPEKWYYWIVRAYLTNGDTTVFSPIHSFYTKPRAEDQRSFFTLCPSVIVEGSMNIQTVWNIDPEISYFSYKIYNSTGEIILDSSQNALLKSELAETEFFPVTLHSFKTGLYIMEITTNLSKAPERLKFLIGR